MGTTKKSRRKFTSAFKVKVVLECLSNKDTLSNLCKKHELHANQILNWKKEFLAKSQGIFDRDLPDRSIEKERDSFLRKIGELEMERDFLKKNLDRSGTWK